MNTQRGFTLMEIAIVLVIIGLLLGGVLKGQELIDAAKVKNLANDFRHIPVLVYGYQDRFRALPGDDRKASTYLTGASGNGDGNGRIDGVWNESSNKSSETILFWEHVRLANLTTGSTQLAGETIAEFAPKNAMGGRVGIQSLASPPITGLRGNYALCSDNILGQHVQQLDATLDNGDWKSGSMLAATQGAAAASTPAATLDASQAYMVCLGF